MTPVLPSVAEVPAVVLVGAKLLPGAPPLEAVLDDPEVPVLVGVPLVCDGAPDAVFVEFELELLPVLPVEVVPVEAVLVLPDVGPASVLPVEVVPADGVPLLPVGVPPPALVVGGVPLDEELLPEVDDAALVCPLCAAVPCAVSATPHPRVPSASPPIVQANKPCVTFLVLLNLNIRRRPPTPYRAGDYLLYLRRLFKLQSH